MAIPNKHIQNYPIFADLTEQRVLIYGGGELAVGKLRRLLSTAAHIVVIAPTISQAMLGLCRSHEIQVAQREFVLNDLAGVALVFAANESPLDNEQIAKVAHQASVLVNVANNPEASSFLVPSLIDRSPLLVAVSSGGSSPLLARLVASRIEAFLPVNYGALGGLYNRYREKIVSLLPDWKQRRDFWRQALNGRVAELILQGHSQKADQAIQELLELDNNCNDGEVYLVGAGPGDPDLLSFRALRLMQQCDVVLYDRLVSKEILSLVNRDAEQVYVGKRRDHHSVPQQSINQRLAALAKQGKRVLRLKGGDPFIFGRGGEEIETLAEEGVDFQVVPGITAASGCASYAGIPLTHRDHAQVCLFVTGHLRDGTVDLDWQALVRPQQTVVIYMGLVGLPHICEQLQIHGLPPDHPIAIIAEGTRRSQHVISATLSDLPARVNASQIKPPTLIIVGHVVRLREKLAWYEDTNSD